MKKQLLYICLAVVISLGLAQGATLVMRTVETYSGACSDLAGFPGLLQKSGFIPKGKCQELKNGACGGECEIGNSGKIGRCVSVGQHNCVCKQERVSPSR
jgi:hypothetical protein